MLIPVVKDSIDKLQKLTNKLDNICAEVKGCDVCPLNRDGICIAKDTHDVLTILRFEIDYWEF